MQLTCQILDLLHFLSMTQNYSVASMWQSSVLSPKNMDSSHQKITKNSFPLSFLNTSFSSHTNWMPFLWHTFGTAGRTKRMLFAGLRNLPRWFQKLCPLDKSSPLSRDRDDFCVTKFSTESVSLRLLHPPTSQPRGLCSAQCCWSFRRCRQLPGQTLHSVQHLSLRDEGSC